MAESSTDRLAPQRRFKVYTILVQHNGTRPVEIHGAVIVVTAVTNGRTKVVVCDDQPIIDLPSLHERKPRLNTRQRLAGLYQDHIDLVQLLADGVPSAGLPDALHVSKSTVKRNLRKLKDALDTETVYGIVSRAFDLGWVSHV